MVRPGLTSFLLTYLIWKYGWYNKISPKEPWRSKIPNGSSQNEERKATTWSTSCIIMAILNPMTYWISPKGMKNTCKPLTLKPLSIMRPSTPWRTSALRLNHKSWKRSQNKSSDIFMKDEHLSFLKCMWTKVTSSHIWSNAQISNSLCSICRTGIFPWIQYEMISSDLFRKYNIILFGIHFFTQKVNHTAS